MTTTEISSERPWEFDRFINGVLMAEGVTVKHAATAQQAFMKAASLTSKGPNREIPVLVLRDRRAAGGEAVAWTDKNGIEFLSRGYGIDVSAERGTMGRCVGLYLHPSNSGVAVPDIQAAICSALLNSFPMADKIADNYAAVAAKAVADLHPSPDTGKSQDQEGTWSNGGKEWTPAVAEVVITDEMVERLRQSAFSEAGIWCPSTGQCRTMLTAALSTKKDA
ncbi:MAG: hypothetical protein P0Y65_05560 [Candidatus Devosia phytovorans]|uniref:Uncharacterized protein n=1 Tax=Candidatus Devosia phytovorans TaxID=3121372 RepID=A0AAJ6B1F1_9HYPH|nr:hypothetical protein [Devosia sp.]WEK05721.1 MAG: hypothetical protein P0Y65_05560 [Devosia sp.]